MLIMHDVGAQRPGEHNVDRYLVVPISWAGPSILHRTPAQRVSAAAELCRGALSNRRSVKRDCTLSLSHSARHRSAGATFGGW